MKSISVLGFWTAYLIFLMALGPGTLAAGEPLAIVGGKIIDELFVPQGTRDFTSYLLKIQQIKPNVVAAAVAGDDSKVMRQQVAQLGMVKNPAWINNQQDWPDIYGLPLANLFGVFGTTWYYELDLPGVKEFVQRYRKMYPDTAMQAPGNVFYNGYMCTKELLSAVERAGTTNNIQVIKQLILNPGSEFRPESTGQTGFMYDHRPMCLFDGLGHQCHIQGFEGSEVNQFGIDT